MKEDTKQQLKDYLCGIVDSGSDSIVTLNGGAAVEMFDRALRMVLSNIIDVNTTADKRTIVLKVEAKPHEDHRSIVGYSIIVPPPKLCGQEPVGTVSDIEIDANGRGPYSVQRSDPQIPLFGPSNVRQIGGNRE